MTRLLDLSCALSDNPRTQPLIQRLVRVQGTNLHTTILHGSEMFWRQLRFKDFDISEMSLASLFILHDRAESKEQVPFVALPIFTTRRAFHATVMVPADSSITTPSQLNHKRVGVPEYQQTAAVWTRGVLGEYFGFDPKTVQWTMERSEERSHATGTGFTPPDGINITYAPHGNSLAQLMAAGQLDACLLMLPEKNLVDPGAPKSVPAGTARTLFRDPAAEAKRYRDATGLAPVNHCVVIRRELAESHPWLILNVYSAFEEARSRWLRTLEALRGELRSLGATVETEGSFVAGASDVFRYGASTNSAELRTLSGYIHDQGLTESQIGPGQIFDERAMGM